MRAADVAAKPMKVTVPSGDDSVYQTDRLQSFSRSAERVTLAEKPDVKDHEFRTAPLNLWPTPREKGKPLAVLKEGGKVAVTGVGKAGFAQILFARPGPLGQRRLRRRQDAQARAGRLRPGGLLGGAPERRPPPRAAA